MSKNIASMTIALGIALCAIALVVAGPADDASAAAGDGGWVDHPGLVPDSPEGGYPIILGTPTIFGVNNNCPQGCSAPRTTRAIDLIGNYIVSGGDFLNIELQNGTVVAQPYLSIVDWRTKQLVCTNLDVDDEVWSIAPGPEANTAIIGGRFDKVNGADGVERTRNKVALIDMDTCEVDKSWIVPGLNGKVTELAVRNNRLFIGGDFTQVAGNSIERLTEVNHDTGAVNTSFDFVFGGELSRAIVGMEVNPAGTRLGIIHRATSIAGQSMRGTAIFNISNPNAPTLTNHRMSTGANAYSNYYDIQDGSISPDFTKMGIAQGTATVSDYATVIPTTEAAGQFGWQHFMRDSSFGIALTNDIAYVSGHFCKIDSGPGATSTMSPNTGPSTCTGSANFFGGVWRTQMAALDINTGRPLTWNPGTNAFVGGRALTVVNRGLLAGFDGDRSDNIRTGSTAFFDFGAPADPRDDQTCSAVVNGGFVNVTWDSVPGIDNYIVRRNSSWLASPGNVTSYTDAPPAGTHTYRIRTVLDGVQRDVDCSPTVTVDVQTQTCTATKNADNSVSLSWDAIAGEDTYIVRRNGSYLSNVGNSLTFSESPGTGVFSYVIRSKRNGSTKNTTCNPSITIGNAGGAQTCSVTDNGDGTITLDWDAIPGEDNYIVRRNGTYLLTAGNVLTYTDTPGAGGATYVIRSKMGATTTNTTCSDGPPAGQTCTATVNGGSVTLTWTAIAGENNYVIRRNGGWIANAGNTLSATVTGHGAGDTYVIRSSLGGVTTNTNCV